MRIGIIGPGRIGGNIARQLASARHHLALSFSRDPDGLARRAAELGGTAGTPAEVVEASEVVVLSVPWTAVELALEQAGSLEGKIVIDTTNQFGASGWQELDGTAARLNASRMPGARYTKSFNTLTSAFQEETASREGDQRVVQWLCGDDAAAKETVARLIRDAGYVPVDVGGIDECAVMEAPRRDGAVYGEEYREAEARAVVDALRGGRPIPPAPDYSG
jgi:8-hydroxy-5-deazaflavin:NADPH oxidoreductase